ncbi:MAG: hypothetical protein ACREI7_03465 [Myxococcota bacterium]
MGSSSQINRLASRRAGGDDLWIAALVLENDLSLATRDRHLAHLLQVPAI